MSKHVHTFSLKTVTPFSTLKIKTDFGTKSFHYKKKKKSENWKKWMKNKHPYSMHYNQFQMCSNKAMQMRTNI